MRALTITLLVVAIAAIIFFTSLFQIDKPVTHLSSQEKAVLEHLGLRYSFTEEGSCKYIVKDGERIGGGYMYYFLKDSIVYGQIGAYDPEIVISADGAVNTGGGCDKVSRERLEAEMDVLQFLGDGYSIEEEGANKYIVKDNKRLTKGYHSYFLKDGVVHGKSGRNVEIVVNIDGR